MTHKLLVDAGNTSVKTALMDTDGHLEPLFNVPYKELQHQQLNATIDVIWLASVGDSEANKTLENWLEQLNAPIKSVEAESNGFGVTNSYERPEELGVDRWLAMIGAYNEQPKATLIIDAGTAITVDWLDESGHHLGGWIVPGVDLMTAATVARAPKVFADADNAWGKAQQLGKSTPECLANGCANAFIGIVQQAFAVSETELDWFDFRVLYSGGSIPLLPNDVKRRGELRTELVLHGLAQYARAAVK